MSESEVAAPVPILRGERVWLRPIEPAELVEITSKIGDTEIAHLAGFKAPFSRAASERFGQQLIGADDQTFILFSIVPFASDDAIGNISLRDIDKVNGSAELAIVLYERRWLGKGYGTDAQNAILDFGFGELRLERIQLQVFDYNERAIRSYRKVGFQAEALLRRARFHRGTHHDVHLMSVLRENWLAMPRKRSWELPEP